MVLLRSSSTLGSLAPAVRAAGLAVVGLAEIACGASPRVAELSAGGDATCARLASGSLRCWGANPYGVLGAGLVEDVVTPPAPVRGIDDAIAIAVGAEHACAVRGSGRVACWGAGYQRQIGDGTQAEHRAPTPVLSLDDAVAVTVGGTHSCALRRDGRILCWGDNAAGQLGDGTTAERASPITVAGLADVSTISAGGSQGGHTCARLAAGEVLCWGYNADGQLGRDETSQWGAPEPVKDFAGVETIAAGGGHCCARMAGGRIACWGNNDYGQLGDGTVDRRTAPVGVLGVRDAIAVATGLQHSCAVQRSGGVVCWGDNRDGQLGDGNASGWRSVPRPVMGLKDAVGLGLGARHSCALRRGEAIVCWGNNDRGQIGDGTRTPRPAPRPVLLTRG